MQQGRDVGASRNKKYAEAAKRLKTVVEDYYNRDIKDYLRSVAYSFQL